MYNCKIYHSIGDITSMTLHNQDYKCLKDIAEDLGLTYQQVADLSSRKEKKKYQQFKFFPEIKITKIQNEIKSE
jgi:predicted DNA-binding ribbon-helix-helix protein